MTPAPTVTPEPLGELRALCPTCSRPVRVRREGKALRMKAHEHHVNGYRGDRLEACPVRGIDAAPLVRAWLARERDTAGRRVAEAATARTAALAMIAKADADEARGHAELERLARLATAAGMDDGTGNEGRDDD